MPRPPGDMVEPGWDWPSPDISGRMMGGEITVESEAGTGSTFMVELPAIVTEQGREIAPAHPMIPQSAPSGDKKVLIIDDDPNVHILLKRFLTQEGFQVYLASNGEEGIHLLKRSNRMQLRLMS